MSQAMEDGGCLVILEVKKFEDQLFMWNAPVYNSFTIRLQSAYKLLNAMNSVSEHEGYDGFKSAPR